jgi:hypothetical protein
MDQLVTDGGAQVRLAPPRQPEREQVLGAIREPSLA